MADRSRNQLAEVERISRCREMTLFGLNAREDQSERSSRIQQVDDASHA
jgi:hypothetical protein